VDQHVEGAEDVLSHCAGDGAADVHAVDGGELLVCLLSHLSIHSSGQLIPRSFYYGTVVFQATGINNVYVTQMILNGINFGVTFMGLYNVEHWGRRKSLIFGSAWMTGCFLIFASVGHFALDVAKPSNTPNEGTVLIVFACLFILGFATTWGPMVWTITAELFPSRYRAKGMALCTASNWLWNFLIAFFTTFITGMLFTTSP
jgi:MFS transporter, SP family, sugar:H+ symporter